MTHRTEMLLLAILVLLSYNQHISAWGCLIRSDYNFVFLFFAYFLLISKKDRISITIVFHILIQIFGLIIMLIIMDIIFFIFIPSSWMSDSEGNFVWNNLQSMHGFAVFIAIIVFTLKVLSNRYRSPYFTWCTHTWRP